MTSCGAARRRPGWWLTVLCLVVATACLPAAAAAQDPEDLAIRGLLQRIEQAAQRGDTDAYLSLLGAAADRAETERFLAMEFRPGATRAVVQERERQHLAGTLPGNGYSLMVDVFLEYGDRARVATWQIDIRVGAGQTWSIASQVSVSSVENIYRLSVNTTRQFAARNFLVQAEDVDLTLIEGTVFTIDTDQGTTGMILVGRGELSFHPKPASEIQQVRIYSGADVLESRFDAAYVRFGALAGHADLSTLVQQPPDPREVRRAEQIFREESAKSFTIDLADLTRDSWSLLPGESDFLAEVRTRRFDTLTYARSATEAEDIAFFERRRKRNIAAYASLEKIATRGRFYDEDDLSPIDVLDYDIQGTYLPQRQFLDAQATMKLRVRAQAVNQLTIRIADSLVVRAVNSNVFGRLFTLRVTNQNTMLVNLPQPLGQDSEITLRVDYGGRIEPQQTERETVTLAPQQDPTLPPIDLDTPFLPRAEPNYLYSSRSYWYPQPSVTDYATATIQLTVPAPFGVIATGERSSDSPRLVAADVPGPPLQTFTFNAERPVRYLAFVVSKLNRADRWTVAFDKPDTDSRATGVVPSLEEASYNKLDLVLESNPRNTGRAREAAERAAHIVQFYESLVGDSPYRSLTVALLESTLPGGHSPAYFAIVNEPLAFTGLTWRNDPAAFASYPEFFMAHEIAHQWWGQGVGWRNYHEQWLSEGFAQYFAALYAQHFRGGDVFANVLRQMGRWGADQSDQGPVYLGYRVGHIRNDGRAFRAVVYNKGAMVLHMLRLLVGDDAFFAGVRRFYSSSRFVKAGTEGFREAMEAEAGRPLERFFERWVYNSTLPRLTFATRVENGAGGQELVIRVEQVGDTFDLPLSVTLQFADRKTTVVVPVTEPLVETRVPLEAPLRLASLEHDDNAFVTIVRN